MMQRPRDGNAIVYCQGGFATTNGKTAHGLVRRTDRYHVLSVIDARHAGRDAGEVLDGKPKGIPVYGALLEAVRWADQADWPATHFVMGLAPDGGRLSEESRRDVAEALELGLNVDSGLHDILSEDPVFSALASLHGATIRDIRKLPPRESMHFFSGKIEEVRSLKIAVLGTDSALGKRTTAWILYDALREAGLSAELIGTGQTAWMQGARYSIIIDSLIVDFVTGEIEHAVWQAWKDSRPDVILIEGQGSLLNPAYPGGMEILSAGRPDVIVVQHAPTRKEYDGFPGYALHSLDVQIRALELLSGRPVGAVTINHEGLRAEEIGETCLKVSRESGLPTADVLVSGAGEVAAQLVRHHPEAYRKYRRNTERGGKWGGGLEGLLAIDRLEVGPVRIEGQRVTAPYSIVQNGAVDSIDFTYSFEEEVLDPGDPSSRNLASMMAAQIALNYGLFCRSILLRGHYDETDRHFLQYMLRNTAREIYVKKLLEHNPFLIGNFVPLKVERRGSYAQAELLFSDDDGSSPGDWAVSRDRCAVLASGGKESLLSFALMDEIGLETYPVFVNESGRHWCTALNSYRTFREEIPRTARVWTNSDRVFSWMLGHLPFIRHNFQDLRADEYPIRLWTVAVFLFGALPILRKKGVGLLLVGNEYDTTRRCRLHGIPHFDGLFDQSRYFDRTMSAYYTCKGWKVEQLSVLRPLSELLVQKILVQRYPELQRNQMSCHAATMEAHRARPCGRCEKCHRVVGMLSALGADPTRCGYREEQVVSCLGELPRRGLHQESTISTHVLHLLLKQGLIEGDDGAAPSPEVESLRFNDEQAPLTALPPELRVPLLKIYLQYARGSLKLTDGRWREFDPMGA
jgi:uncharacterized NAD-dependent epimerase/dehydratase family protein